MHVVGVGGPFYCMFGTGQLFLHKFENLEANLLYMESQSLNISERISSNHPFINPETHISVNIKSL